MPDMLVNLLHLPDEAEQVGAMRNIGVVIRRANTFEASAVRRFIEDNFSTGWADEVMPCFSRQPVSLHIAIADGEIIGFAAVEATCRNYFGPTGVLPQQRGRGVGTALLVVALHSMRTSGYAYGIIGGVGPAEFYAKGVGATIIPDSTPGIYANPLRKRS